MPIHLTCACGKRLAAANEAAGLLVRCPTCGALAEVPAVAVPAEASGETPGADAATAEGGGAELLSAAAKRCRFCSKAIPLEASACPNCGLDLMTGRHVAAMTGYAPTGPSSYRAGPPAQRWATVRRGLGVIFVGYLLGLLLMPVQLGMNFVYTGFTSAFSTSGPSTSFSFNSPDTQQYTLLAMIPAILIGFINLLGLFHCIAAPRESGAKGLAIGAVICATVGIVFSILHLVAFSSLTMQMAGPSPGFSPASPPIQPVAQSFGFSPLLIAAPILGGLLWLVAVVLFLLFLRGTARFFGDEGLARSVIGLLIYVACAIGASIVFSCISMIGLVAFTASTFRNQPSPNPGALAGNIATGMWLIIAVPMILRAVGYIWLLRLIRGTRKLIGTALDQAAATA